jgi:hypothetical protein
MTEKDACALLKARFEKAGYAITENVAFAEDGVAFEIDGFDAHKRVGYEYLTEEAGDGWDVDGDVIATLEGKRDAGELFILVVDEKDAADAAALGRAADVFLEQLAADAKSGDADDDDDDDDKPAAKKPAKPAAKKPAAKKPAAKRAAKPTKSPPKKPAKKK